MSLRQEFEKSDSYNEFCHNLEWNNGVGRYKDVKTQHEFQLWCDGWQACAERKDAEIAALRGFAIWLTGCGYDFPQHQYFLDNRHLLIGDTGETE